MGGAPPGIVARRPLRLFVDQKKCIGAGQCVRVAPMLFAQDEETGLVLLRDPQPAPEHESAARDAAELCPAEVISLGDPDG